MDDTAAMIRALELAASVRTTAAPNPWVGCVVVDGDRTFEGATQPPGGLHAEAVALAAAGHSAEGATLVTTLEPCAHTGRTGPCADAIIAAGVARVVVGIQDPDLRVSGRGLSRLVEAGIELLLGIGAEQVSDQLAPYLAHRRTGRPWVVLKLAATLDGRIAAPDGSSKWITGADARADVARLRAESGAILVGAGTIRTDDPALTVHAMTPVARQPLRVVLGRVPPAARVRPALELSGDLGGVLDELGRRDVLQVLIEGGASVAYAFHRAGLVNRYVLYLAPKLMGGDDGRPLFAGPGAATLAECWSGRLVSVRQLGGDLRVELAPELPPAR
ncbi:MAG: bifunctional diaminohydroxyphosphoribosylaminopyrimidine deaminase/5-amino-6-(5-phosphoribosylamino)uracil reductase RibD [Acidimicrobiales bacterium]